ncbi:AraC family transcription regulator [Yersinia frederiksenii]|uniref:AraC family transcription regulator n=2 Tax=Yersinia frederiksenii TaxID=29484 RepID=A0A380PTW9_YERFR|nr:AraC family transcriptional regulator [Yersinia frederiksenii]ATM94763.1 AraC family transcriptional regulator [Yersinia frederiksenii]EEQ13452.1 AraC-family transcriptional regulator [Yersinia frederiksenii ATCC 33641]KGA48686.1 helix-turn-helix domain protein [Yersinia frederiksenii ATCC 33641]MDN0121017.1 AraC family transcriptional regulator [Yersinia frederiksenii]CND13299.1 AraC family transcription regulator [Yersinia frederiksenii]
MPLIPVSFLLSILCIGLFYHLIKTGRQSVFLLLLLLVCALQSGLIGLRYGYHLALFNGLQPIVAMTIPPLTYLALLSTAKGSVGISQEWKHSLAPMGTLICVWLAPQWLDAIVIISYVAYGLAVLVYLRLGEDRLQQVSLEKSWLSYRLWLLMAILLIGSGMADIIISVDYALFAGNQAGVIVSFSNLLITLVMCYTLATSARRGESISEVPAEAGIIDNKPDNEALEELFSAILLTLKQNNLYLDSQLNLSKLARKVGVPARKVSQAINQQTGQNVSQYVNQLRIDQAAKLLSTTELPVVDIMLEAGFQTKSNFNREFMRVKGMTPSQWREQQLSTDTK